MANRRYEQFFYSMHKKPVHLDCSFTVDSTNVNGISGLVGPGISSVYMHSAASFTADTHTNTVLDSISINTSNLSVGMLVQGSGIPSGTTIASITSASAVVLSQATTATAATVTVTYASSGNPNPAAGFILVNLQDCFNWFYGMNYDVRSPYSGSDVKIDNSAMTVGQLYVITTLGNASLAKWQAIGVPAGITPAVGVAFIAISNGGAGNVLTSKVQVLATAGANISHIEVAGNPNKSIMSSRAQVAGSAGGSYLLLQCMKGAFSGSALGSHVHDMKIIGGQAASTTNDVAVYGGDTLGKELATDATIVGANSATKGGVVAVSAGTPAGTMSSVLAAPADGSVIDLSFLFSSSRITVQGD